jgi:phosphatidylglycerol:prolipoprotein diacylglycerol transferase
MPTAMPDAVITFPMLGDWFRFDWPNTYHLFGLTFHWYGAIIALGFLLAVLYGMRHSRDFGITQDELTDAMIIGVPVGVIGARLYYVVFHFDEYAGQLMDMVKVWRGGLAIYGGVIAAALTVYFFCRHRKIPVGAMLDILAFGLLIGQAVGRWANFINREAFGAVTDVFCRMGLTPPGGETVYVHPTFLYESLWNLLGLLFLDILRRRGKRKFDGEYFLIYVAWYGLGRMFIEGLRTDSLYLFGTGIRVSQLLAALSFLAASVLLILLLRRPGKPEAIWVNRRRGNPEAEEAGKKES